MNLQHLSDEKLDQQTLASVTAETDSTLRVLHHLREVDKRRLFSKLKFKSLLDYAEKRLGYPYDQAWRRIEAMRLLREMPEIENKIADGTLNLTNIGYAQAAFKSEAKKEAPLCREQKLKFLSQIENKSTRATQKLVAEKFGSEVLIRETVKPVSASLSMMSVPVRDDFLEKLDELKGLLAHSRPSLSTAELLDYAVSITLEKLFSLKFGCEKVSAPRKSGATSCMPEGIESYGVKKMSSYLGAPACKYVACLKLRRLH